MTFLLLSVILLSMLMILISVLSVIRHLICGNNQNWLLNLNLIYETLDWDRKWLVDFNARKTQLLSLDRSNNTGAIDLKMDWSVLEKKSYFKKLGLTFFSKLDWGSDIISIAKTVSKKIGALICSMRFLSPQVALYLYKSTIRPCIECQCYAYHAYAHAYHGPYAHARPYAHAYHASVPSCYWQLLDKLHKRICRTVGIILVDVRLNWLNQFHVLSLDGGLLFIRLIARFFLSSFLKVTRMSMSTVSFLAQLDSEFLCLKNAFLYPII